MTSPQNNHMDLSPEVLSLARMLMRECRQPGHYSIDFEVSDHQRKIKTAVIARVENIRTMNPKPDLDQHIY
jgi:hypothetical protein